MGKDRRSDGQRRARRIPYPVNVIIRPGEGLDHHKGEARNLSNGGMFIKTMLPLKPGTVFEVEVPMLPLNYIGPVRVLWKRDRDEGPEKPYGMAVEWLDLTPDQRKQLYRQIDEHVRSGGELLVGSPEPGSEDRPPASAPAGSAAAAPDRTKLFVGIALAAVVVLVVLFVLS